MILKFILVMLAAAVLVQSFPTQDDDITKAVAAGNYDEVRRILKQKYNFTPPSLGDVRSLKPEPGGRVYGESEYTFRSSTNINGKTDEQSGGHKIINDNGRVTEYNFKP